MCRVSDYIFVPSFLVIFRFGVYGGYALVYTNTGTHGGQTSWLSGEGVMEGWQLSSMGAYEEHYICLTTEPFLRPQWFFSNVFLE